MIRIKTFTPVLLAILLIALFMGCGDNDGTEQEGPPVDPAPYFPQSVLSGDPRPDSVILWTRVVDNALPGQDLLVSLTVATDENFGDIVYTKDIVARAEYDNCVKVRITGLDPRTFYYYRFTYNNGDSTVISRTGRTKTAPSPGDNVPVRWIFFSCQDYVGRYYNSYLHLLNTYNTSENDLDFLIFLGDYIYENTGDPSFQTPGESRSIQFEDTAGAIEQGEPGETFYSARSLSNYRDLYKIYRSDVLLQQVHEKFPMIVVWDDHEFSDDSWQDVSTYFDGRVDERDPERKQNAERAFFEYIPIEIGLNEDNELEITEDILFPNTLIYRDFNYGAHVDLVLTDYRTYRPDHLIPEDAFPGTVVVDNVSTQDVMGPLYTQYESALDPYIDIDGTGNETLKADTVEIVAGLYSQENENLTLSQAALKADEVVVGNLSALYINDVFEEAGLDKPFDETALELMPLGIAYRTVGKQSLYSDLGSRYLVSQDMLFYLGTYLNNLDDDVDDAYGPEQEAWFTNVLAASDATWKIFVNSVSFTPMILDFTHPTISPFLPGDFPDELRARMQINAEQWDGLPVKKNEMLNYLSTIPGAVIISGDIHASFVCDHGDRSSQGGSNRVYEFTGTAVSSTTIREFIFNTAANLGIEGVESLVPMISTIFQLSSIGNPISSPSEIVYNEPGQNGYVFLEATSDTLTVTYHHYPSDLVHDDFYENFQELEVEFSEISFRIEDGILSELP